MSVREFLSTFKSSDVQVTIIDAGAELITFKASGYTCLEDSLETREIKEWIIVNPVSIKITLVPEITSTSISE